MAFFYKPADGWAADVIPFYWQGVYHLFYLKDYRDSAGHGEGTPWYHLSTGDFVTFEDHGEALERGSVADQDLYVFTGSVLEKDGVFHIYYTGHNPHYRSRGWPEQAVMHAVSTDLQHWRKLPADTLAVPGEGYDRHDWRDPFVFWNEEAGEYWMLLAARHRAGGPRRRGCTALCASRDSLSWQLRSPLWSPNLYYTHECPDLFKIGAWWYLVFSEFSEASVTRYRMARSSRGPWLKPANDTFDGRAFYAAKTASDGQNRYLFGWNPTRVEDWHSGAWQWGGNIVVHEVYQAADGSLDVRIPRSIQAAFTSREPITFAATAPNITVQLNTVTIDAPYGFSSALADSISDCCRISMSIVFAGTTGSFGLVLRAIKGTDSAYFIRFDVPRNRLVLDSWPRPGDVPFMVELERPLQLVPGTALDVEVVIDGTVCEVYASGIAVMSARLYPLPVGTMPNSEGEEGTLNGEKDRQDASIGTGWGLFVLENTATFHDVSVFTREPLV